MYSTKLKSSELRYIPTCIINKLDSGVLLMDTLIDTGAKYTCYSSDSLDTILSEDQFKNTSSMFLSGFVDEQNGIKFYKYRVKQFIIGNIDLGSQFIWITFDKRITDNVVGMDILSQVTFLQYANTNILYFFKDKKELEFFFGDVIVRRCYRCNNGMFNIILSNTPFYFYPNIIKQDEMGYFIMLGKQKCYLKF